MYTRVGPEGRPLCIDVPESNACSADGVVGPEGAEVLLVDTQPDLLDEGVL